MPFSKANSVWVFLLALGLGSSCHLFRDVEPQELKRECDCAEKPNAEATCSESGVCFYDCLRSFADCNQDLSDGCEVSLNEPSNCGSCGVTCDLAGRTAVCVEGQCAPGDGCIDGFVDLNRDVSDGCECQVSTEETLGDGVDSNCDGLDGDANDVNVFVSMGGDDTQDGLSPSNAVQSIRRGIEILAENAGGVLYIAGGVYAEEPVVNSVNLSIYGGYSADFQTRDIASYPVEIRPDTADGRATLEIVGGSAIVLDGLSIFGAERTPEDVFVVPGMGNDPDRSVGRSSVAVMLQDVGDIEIHRSRIIAGTGADGSDGAEASVYDEAAASALEPEGAAPAAGAASPCGATGGRGGTARFCPSGASFGGGRGSASDERNSAGGGGTSVSCGGGCLIGPNPGGDGTVGGNGAPGAAGLITCETARPRLVSDRGDFFRERAESAPAAGESGVGGGGGGAGTVDTCITVAPHGGGGGAGGCGGDRGENGGQGGDAIGLLAVNVSSLRGAEVEIVLGQAGAGGGGSLGAEGQEGGSGSGGLRNAGSGGDGGDGGRGGSGAGGGGGSSVGLLWLGTEEFVAPSWTFTVELAVAGRGGTGFGTNSTPCDGDVESVEIVASE